MGLSYSQAQSILVAGFTVFEFSLWNTSVTLCLSSTCNLLGVAVYYTGINNQHPSLLIFLDLGTMIKIKYQLKRRCQEEFLGILKDGKFERRLIFRSKTEKNTSTWTFSYVRHHNVFVKPGTIITTRNKLKKNCQETLWIRLSGKQVRTESLNIFRYLWPKQAENTETSSLNDACCHKFIVDPRLMIIINNQMERKCQ